MLVSSVLTDLGADLGGAIAAALLRALVISLAPGLLHLYSWGLQQLIVVSTSTAQFDPHAQFFLHAYQQDVQIAGLFVVPALLVGVIAALWLRDLGEMVRLLLVRVPAVVVVGVGSITVLSILSEVVDQASRALLSGRSSFAGLQSAAARIVTSQGVPLAVVIVLFVLGAVSVVAIWIELVVRSGLLYVMAAVLPLASIGLLFPTGRTWLRRSTEAIVAVLVSKFFMVLSLSLAVGAVSDAYATKESLSDAVSLFVSGIGLMLVTIFAPYLVIRMIPFAEAHLAAVSDGVSTSILRRSASLLNDGIGLVEDPQIPDFGGSPTPTVPYFGGYQPTDDDLARYDGHRGAWAVFGDYLQERGRRPPDDWNRDQSWSDSGGDDA